jgi:hypothetical protein
MSSLEELYRYSKLARHFEIIMHFFLHITQMVHLLPYERLDLYKEAVRRMTAMADCLGDHKKCKNFKDACGDPVCMPAANQLQQTEEITEDSSELGPQEVHDQDGVPLTLVEGEGCDNVQEGTGQPGQTVEKVVHSDVAVDDCNKDAEKDKESVESQAGNVKSLKNQKQSRKNHQGNKKKEAFLKCPWTTNHASKDRADQGYIQKVESRGF